MKKNKKNGENLNKLDLKNASMGRYWITIVQIALVFAILTWSATLYYLSNERNYNFMFWMSIIIVAGALVLLFFPKILRSLLKT